jgi:outer membrane protein assembly factor BamB
MSGSPLVYDQLVVVNPGVQRKSVAGHALVAYDRSTGRPVWHAGNARAAYSSPMLAILGNQRQILLFDADGLGGYDATTGQELWRYEWKTAHGINAAQPVVLEGDRVFLSSGYDHGCTMLLVTKTSGRWTATPLWPNTPNQGMRCKFSSPVASRGFLYGLDDGRLVCLDATRGERMWKGGRYGHGQLLLAGDLLVILAESGRLVLVAANPERFHELGSISVLEGEKTWNPLALAGGKVFVRNHVEMACYELPLLERARAAR